MGQAADDGIEQYGDVLLSAADKRLCMGGLGRMDSRWEDSGRRMWEVFGRLRDGDSESTSVSRGHVFIQGR
ncbi:hypothetical protein SISSUDRAFT_1055775 [Sistotremastrum suecicum HHB10207 ss-3]|uniref:Uncharacterized protein n=1 Tax=Sistotremastrum suecicum HHB10207 ss-3 TaxID=1314776 RepID=A0A165XJB8_9AGAM|nr:hypothetical protein SISSUDRAFT_1055775 [Sistotremastrum suecicum HHB10207 ss-3]